MNSVAAEAKVAVQTMYFTFHTKIALLREAFEHAVLGPGVPTPPSESAWYREMVAEPDPARALAIVVDNAADIASRVGPLLAVFESLVHEPQAASFYEATEKRRRAGYEGMVGLLAKKGGLKKGLTHRRAADVLFVILSPDMVRKLLACGWTLPECKRWLAEVLEVQLLGE
jgi:AcrR family transcriptional regulator